MSDTIFALATPPGRGAIGVIRVSGPLARAALAALAPGRITPRRASLRTLRRPGDGAMLDQALVLWFPSPDSFTGEDCLELHLHGGSAVAEGVTAALLGLGLRLAEPGEFTRRAFERGRLDLSQAEAVADLVDAETESQRRQALAQLGGALSRRHALWREALIEALSVLEAAVDFPDEDLPPSVSAEAFGPLAYVAGELEKALESASRGERVREGYRIALIGPPNAGKSSLLNALVGSEAAIVTATPGTTRDIIEVALDLGGFRVLIADTAGLRDTEDLIEREGVRRASERAVQADLRVLMIDAASSGTEWGTASRFARADDLCLVNKVDLAPGDAPARVAEWAGSAGLHRLEVSVLTGEGMADLEAWLQERVTQALGGAEFPAATRARHRGDLTEALGHIKRALGQGDDALNVELVAEDVRLAARCLARVGGRIDAEQVLDRVFGRFCIGK